MPPCFIDLTKPATYNTHTHSARPSLACVYVCNLNAAANRFSAMYRKTWGSEMLVSRVYVCECLCVTCVWFGVSFTPKTRQQARLVLLCTILGVRPEQLSQLDITYRSCNLLSKTRAHTKIPYLITLYSYFLLRLPCSYFRDLGQFAYQQLIARALIDNITRTHTCSTHMQIKY